MSGGRRASFVVRIVEDGKGGVTGVVERVATGAKEAFTGTEAIGRVIALMLQADSVEGDAATEHDACTRDDKWVNLHPLSRQTCHTSSRTRDSSRRRPGSPRSGRKRGRTGGPGEEVAGPGSATRSTR
jgi:hypothetical protein